MGAILLASGNSFDLSSPETSTYTIEDIAHGLSMICRFAGQCSRFYSVAQHSVLASLYVAPEHAYQALMHDAAEAIIGDVTKPLKKLLPDYQALEKRIEAPIFARFGVPYPLSAEVKDIDVWMLATEQHQLMPDREGRSYAGGKEPLPITLWPMTPDEAKDAFLARYVELHDGPNGLGAPSRIDHAVAQAAKRAGVQLGFLARAASKASTRQTAPTPTPTCLGERVDNEIRHRLAAIQDLFKPGAKVLLLIDNGCADTSVLIGDADVEAAIARIRELEGGTES